MQLYDNIYIRDLNYNLEMFFSFPLGGNPIWYFVLIKCLASSQGQM